jgi:hypothetical protein
MNLLVPNDLDCTVNSVKIKDYCSQSYSLMMRAGDEEKLPETALPLDQRAKPTAHGSGRDLAEK